MSNDTNATPFKITSAGVHVRRDGRQVYLRPAERTDGLNGEWEWIATSKGQESESFRSDGTYRINRATDGGDIVARADVPTPTLPQPPAPTSAVREPCPYRSKAACRFLCCPEHDPEGVAEQARRAATQPTMQPTPTRLDRARAALEEAQALRNATLAADMEAAHQRDRASKELAAAEQEEAARAVIPAGLLTAARHVVACDASDWNTLGVLDMLAHSHGIQPADLRARLESEKT